MVNPALKYRSIESADASMDVTTSQDSFRLSSETSSSAFFSSSLGSWIYDISTPWSLVGLQRLTESNALS